VKNSTSQPPVFSTALSHALRICSLLPSTTEILFSLGLEDSVVGVTHECDYPPAAQHKPRVTTSVIDSESLTSRQIDEAVRDSLKTAATIYHLDRELLDSLRPDLILTQELCDVCAVGFTEVREVVSSLSCDSRIVSLEPTTLAEVLDSILQVGRLTGTLRRAIEVNDGLRERFDAVQQRVSQRAPIRVLTLEWLDPVFVGGHWVPEMVRLAGGHDVLGQEGQPSREATWDEVLESKPQVIVAMPCGFGLEKSWVELAKVELPSVWQDLPAVQANQVYVVDGSSYFNRPGPRLVDGVEILASILHPDLFERSGQHVCAQMPQPVSAARRH
jgi:iron complex transport system substrate-binding protein